MDQFPESRYNQAYYDQTQMAYTPGYDPYPNDYNSGWGAQPDFSWEPHPVVPPAIQRPMFVDTTYDDMPYSDYQPSQTTYSPLFQEKDMQALDRVESLQPSPPTYSPSFEEKVLKALERIEGNTQTLNSHTQSIAKLETQIGQLTAAFREVEEMPSQPENNLEEPYPAEYLNDPLSSPDQPIITLGNELVIEQPCTTNRTNLDNLTREELYIEKPDWWDEPISSSPYPSMTPFPNVHESSNLLNGKGEQISAMMKFTEISHEPQVNDIIGKATPTTHHQNSLDPYMAQFGVDDFDGYISEINEPTPYFEPTPSLIEKYESSPSLPIVPLLESPPTCELEPLPVKPTDTLPVILNQEDQLSGILNTHKEAVGWDISKMRDPDLEKYKLDFSIFGTTFKNCLQNLTELLARCMETGLVLIWRECQDFNQHGVQLKHVIPENGFRQDPILINEIHKLPPPFSDQQTRLLNHKDHYNIFKSGHIMLAQYTLLRAKRRRTLYGHFSAMMTRPPDWPCLVRTLGDMFKCIITNTPS